MMKALFRTLFLLLPLAAALPAAAWSDMEEEAAPNDASAVVIPEITDLRAEATLARKERLPILVMFSSDYCPYCTAMKNDFLKPMMYSGDYDRKILFRMVKLTAGKSIVDFDGNPVNVYDFAERYKVRVTPTLVFIDYQGKGMAPKMVGMTTPDFFGGYLDDAITTAYDHVRNGSTFACKDAHTRLTC
jgi:thioredoxin-related protein